MSAGNHAIAIGTNTIAEDDAIAIGDFVHAKKGEVIIKTPISLQYPEMIDLQIKCPLCLEWIHYDNTFVHKLNLDCKFDNQIIQDSADNFKNRDDFIKLKVMCPICNEWLEWRDNVGCRHIGECIKK